MYVLDLLRPRRRSLAALRLLERDQLAKCHSPVAGNRHVVMSPQFADSVRKRILGSFNPTDPALRSSAAGSCFNEMARFLNRFNTIEQVISITCLYSVESVRLITNRFASWF